jgi:hypothetical protein
MMRWPFGLVLAALLVIDAAAQAPLTTLGVGPGAMSSGCSYPLDGLSASATAAYALRPLSSSWNGNLITLVRSSDSSQQTFGVSGCGLASTSAFCNTTTCKVVTLYDQSGNGIDLTQSRL